MKKWFKELLLDLAKRVYKKKIALVAIPLFLAWLYSGEHLLWFILCSVAGLSLFFFLWGCLDEPIRKLALAAVDNNKAELRDKSFWAEHSGYNREVTQKLWLYQQKAFVSREIIWPVSCWNNRIYDLYFKYAKDGFEKMVISRIERTLWQGDAPRVCLQSAQDCRDLCLNVLEKSGWHCETSPTESDDRFFISAIKYDCLTLVLVTVICMRGAVTPDDVYIARQKSESDMRDWGSSHARKAVIVSDGPLAEGTWWAAIRNGVCLLHDSDLPHMEWQLLHFTDRQEIARDCELSWYDWLHNSNQRGLDWTSVTITRAILAEGSASFAGRY